MTGAAWTLAAAALLSIAATWACRRLALSRGLVDAPDGNLKRHGAPVPLLGGAGVFAAFALASAYSVFSLAEKPGEPSYVGLLGGACILLLVGAVDDARRLGWKLKLVAELAIAVVLARAGVRLQIEFLPDALNYLGSALWIVGVANAVNLIDVMDGLASGTCAVAAMTLAAIGLLTGNLPLALAAAALAGALLGFLVWNWRPARIYLGDAGSLFIGFTLAALSMWASYTVRHRAALGVPLLVLGVPLFETLFLVVMRLRRGRSPFQGSPDHFALRLRSAGWSVPRIVLTTIGVTCLLGLMGILAMHSIDAALAMYGTGAAIGVYAWKRLAPLEVPE
ncbi:MAG: MraY family glycosyltransferase [Planctomycetota bacterium]